MKLTENEKAICKKYSARDEEGLVHCNECPLFIDNPETWNWTCYANIDGQSAEAKMLKRL